jgi:serine/threonine-protein kinase
MMAAKLKREPNVQLQVISHYEIGELIGQGGMGSVYRARDVSLDRMVALKFLSPALVGSGEARARFLREGRALSSLSHPHIGTVYEAGESDGTLFLALELLPGGTLGAKLKSAERAGALIEVRHLLQWGREIAEGLAHAHRHGIIHRDIKPANILFDAEGRAKLTDFGLARRTHGDSQSETGRLAGTFGYMAPEQIEGCAADHRSDQFSFGVVLYEMATGVAPFRGSTPGEVTHQLLHHRPPPPSQVRPELPPMFDSLMERLLAKKPQNRFERTADIAAELRSMQAGTKAPVVDVSTVTQVPLARPRRRWVVVAAALLMILLAVLLWNPVRNGISARRTPAQKHIAVLPFRNIGGDASQESFCDGLTETLTSTLSKHGSFAVVPPTESRNLKSAEQARREFGVNLVVYGSVQRRGDRVRLILSLIDAQSRRQIDAQPVDWPLDHLDEIEEGMLNKVSDLLNLVLTGPAPSVWNAKASQLPGAYDAYLRGRGYLYRFDRAGNLDRARQEFEQAIQLDPSFAAAFAGLAETHLRDARQQKSAALGEAALAAAARARELAPNFATAHILYGGSLATLGRGTEAAKALEEAARLDPRDPAVYRELGRLYWTLNRHSDAERVYRRAISERPGDWMSFQFAASYFASRQKFDEAERLYRKAIDLSPDNHAPYQNLGAVLLRTGRLREAEQVMRRAVGLKPTSAGYSNLAALYMYQGRYREAIPFAENAVRLAPSDYPAEYRIWGNLGDAYWLAGEPAGKSRKAWTEARDRTADLVSRAPANALHLAHLAKFEAKLQRPAEAERHAAAAVKLLPDDAAVRFQCSLALAVAGRLPDALAHLEAAVARNFPVDEIRRSPELAPLRNSQRFQQLVQIH